MVEEIKLLSVQVGARPPGRLRGFSEHGVVDGLATEMN